MEKLSCPIVLIGNYLLDKQHSMLKYTGMPYEKLQKKDYKQESLHPK